MKGPDVLIKICSSVIIVFTIAIGIHNCCNDIESFLLINVSQVLTIIIAVGIAFFATQIKNDQRKSKDHAQKVVEKIQRIVSDDTICCFNSSDNVEKTKKQTLMILRKLNNSINILKEYSKKLDFEDNAEYIDDQYKQFKTFVSEHIEDLDYLEKSEEQLRRYAENIDSKCDVIILNFYK